DGTFITAWGSGGSDEGQFNSPTGITADRQGNIFVADSENNRIQKFSDDGTFITAWGSGGSDEGQFNNPTGITVDSQGNVFVAEFLNHRVQKLGNDGTFITAWGGRGSDEGQFYFPTDITADSRGNVFVTDNTNRVQKFSNDGTFITAWGNSGSGEVFFNVPAGITVDSQRDVFVADADNRRIHKFAPNYPDPDPEHGLALNGSFEASPVFTHWRHGGNLDRSLSSNTPYGNQAARLGEPVPQTNQPAGSAWLHQTIYVPPEWERPILSFNYRMFVNDTIDYSDFRVWVTMSNGGVLAELLRDGYRSCHNTAPAPGTDLGWRQASYDLSKFKGQTVRIRFENRNIHHNKSWGIWTYVDNVSVLDAGVLPPPGSERVYLPLVRKQWKQCDG
ncbi:MAG: hypothetical protein KC423_17275, partial [Anaerolineales bacterium]|nr:hypothetical protein [Anaerolineales bacterium]